MSLWLRQARACAVPDALSLGHASPYAGAPTAITIVPVTGAIPWALASFVKLPTCFIVFAGAFSRGLCM